MKKVLHSYGSPLSVLAMQGVDLHMDLLQSCSYAEVAADESCHSKLDC
jgi:hypothetical protein